MPPRLRKDWGQLSNFRLVIMKISTCYYLSSWKSRPIMMKMSTYHDENLDRSSQKSRLFIIKSRLFNMKISTVRNKISTDCHENKSYLFAKMVFHMQAIAIHILVNISRSKGNQAMKFRQLIGYKKKNIFPHKSCKKWGRETSPRPLSVS